MTETLHLAKAAAYKRAWFHLYERLQQELSEAALEVTQGRLGVGWQFVDQCRDEFRVFVPGSKLIYCGLHYMYITTRF